MMKGALYIFLVFCVLACKKTETPGTDVTHTYELVYNFQYKSSTNKTAAWVVVAAIPDDNKTKILNALPGDESLFFENMPLQFDGTSYRLVMNGKIEGGNFTFVDEKGVNYINHVILPKPIAQPNMDTIGVDYNYVWIGDPVDTNEVVVLRLTFLPYTTPAHTTVSYLEHTTFDVGDQDIGKLQFLGNRDQNNDFELSRHLYGKIQQPTNGGSRISSIYTAESRTVYLKY